jgi:hypothetical protein
VEGVGSPEWQKRSRTRPRPQVEIEKWKKVLFFGEDGIFFAKLAFSFWVFDNLYTSLINLKRDNLLILARREF